MLAGLVALDAGLPAMVAAGLALLVQCAATGAMHEDGLADTLDGLWGGHTREARLEIMKDSAVGAYGAVALVISLGLRWSLLAALLPVAPGAIIAAACLSRAGMPVLMAALPHARDFGLSHGVGRPTTRACAIGLALGLVLAFLTAGLETITGALLGALLLAWLARQARKRIGGQTGDILGASQQLGEIAMLLALAAHL
jgi:adenosylcobinamide-GDP ribazoletransferase